MVSASAVGPPIVTSAAIRAAITRSAIVQRRQSLMKSRICAILADPTDNNDPEGVDNPVCR